MERGVVWRLAKAGGLALALTSLAWLGGAPAGAFEPVPEICFLQHLESSPLTAASGEKLECTVVNDGNGPVGVQIQHVGNNGQVLMTANRMVPPGGFRSSVYMVPFGGAQAYCEVHARVCMPLDTCIATGFEGPEVHGNLTRQDAATRDEAESELVPSLVSIFQATTR